MTYLRRLLRVELRAQVALVVGCALFSVVATAFTFLATPSQSDDLRKIVLGGLGLMFAAFYLFGLVPVAIYGAPAYALLEHHRRANWPYVIALGLVPAPFIAMFGVMQPVPDTPGNIRFALAFSMCGLVVASLTHLLCRPRARVLDGL